MNHKLAKELKDAGFPQQHATAFGRRYFIHDRKGDVEFVHEGGVGRVSVDNAFDEGDITLLPTLEELIEACGEPFMLVKPEGDMQWKAHKDRVYPVGIGFTPTEAVARLWLALNKKS